MLLSIPRNGLEGGYEIVAGHRRKRGSELAGKSTMPVIVRELDDDEATIIMVDSNLQREKILPSEKAFAYRMKMEALKHQGKRLNSTSARPVQKLTTRDQIAQDAGEKSGMAVARYISLTKLIPPLLAVVDEGKLSVSTAADCLSDLTETSQSDLVTVMDKLGVVPTLSQLTKIKDHSKVGTLTISVIEALLSEERPAASLSTVVTACICFRLSWQNIGAMLVLIVLSSFVAALIGLFIGKFSEGLMIGVVYIKIVMLVFIAVPIVCALIGVSGPLVVICNIVPSQPAFDGIMSLSAGNMGTVIKDIGILAIHCVAWFALYVLISTQCKRRATQ